MELMKEYFMQLKSLDDYKQMAMCMTFNWLNEVHTLLVNFQEQSMQM